MKKFIALLQIFVLLLCSFAVTATAADFTDTEDEAITVITNLGLMQGYDDGTFLPENTMTRGEFAQLIANIYEAGTDDIKAWKDVFFREEKEELELVEEFEQEVATTFSDVESNHWAYNAVNTVNSLGFMTGVGNGEFAPDSIITLEQAYKVIITMLGYQMRAVVQGGYPSGYLRTARELRITSGVSESGNALRGDVARILYNSFDVELLQLTGVGDKNSYDTIAGETFLTNILGLTYTEGRMTDNGIANFKGASTHLKDSITINDSLTFKIDETRGYLRDYIGRQVRIYHTNDDKQTVQTAVFGLLNGRDNAITFDAKDYVSFSSNVLTYRDTNGKIKTIQLSVPNNMIYNKTGIVSYNDAFFKSINKGTITVVETDGKNDLILVDSYFSFYVDIVDALLEKIYSTSALVTDSNGNPTEGSKVVDLNTKDKTVVIYAADGTVTDFSALTIGSVLSISESDAYTRVYISGTKVTGFTVNQSYTKDGISYVAGEKAKYAISNDFIDLKGTNEIVAGKIYTLYIDHFGEIINVVEEAASGMVVALLVDQASSGVFDAEVQIKYYTTEGKMETSYLAQKVKVKHEDNSELSYSDLSVVSNYLSAYNGLVRLGFDENKDVNYIEFAGIQSQQIGTNPENRLLRIKLDKDKGEACDPRERADLHYKIYQGFGGIVTVDTSKTKLFQYQPDLNCPDPTHEKNSSSGECLEVDCVYSINYKYERAPKDEKSYMMAGFGQFGTDGGADDMWAYTTLGDSRSAQYMVREDIVTTTSITYSAPMMIFKETYKALNDEEEPTNVIVGYSTANKEVEFYCEDEVLNDIADMYGRRTKFNGAGTDAEGAVSQYTLEPGDVFRYATEADGVTIKEIQLMFDENAINPHSGGRGHLVGTVGYYDGTIYSMPNQHGKSTWGTNGNNYHATERKWAVYYPIAILPGESRYTTMDLSVFDYDALNFDSSKYIVESYRNTLTTLGGSGGIIYVVRDGELTQETLNTKTWQNSGTECDRSFMAKRTGEGYGGFTIRYVSD